MRVVFIEDVEGVAFGGEVKEVKNGFARNYLIPKNLAAPATHNNLQRIHKLTKNAAVTRAHRLDEMKNLAGNLDGSEITIEMRAGANNRLYGSVTGTMVADALAEETGIPIERRLVQLDDPIREVGTYEVPLRLYAEINASITVIVYATGNLSVKEKDLLVGKVEKKIIDIQNINNEFIILFIPLYYGLFIVFASPFEFNRLLIPITPYIFVSFSILIYMISDIFDELIKWFRDKSQN